MAERTIAYRFIGRFEGLTAGLSAAGRSVNDFGDRLTAADRNGERMRRGLSSIGDTAGKVGLAAAAGLGAIVAVTAKFESAMSRVSAATNASQGDLEKLRAAAIKAGADTVFSATEAADGITELGKAGLSTSDILSGGLTGALNLAAAGQISVADAAATTAITLSQYGLAGDQASRVSDTLAASAGKALGSVEDMSEALKYVGPVASQMGLSLEDTTGVIAELASQGILGSQAGTSLRGMLTSLTSPSKQATLTMQGLGISMYDAQGKFVGLEGIAGQLHDTMGGLTNAERDQALGRIFGNEQITAARILYAGGAADVQKWTDQVTDSGYAADQAAKLTDNLAGDLEQFKGSLETALIGAGEGSQGPLRGLVQKGTEAVNVFNTLPGPIKSTTTGLLAIVAVTGGAAFFGAKVVSGIAATNTALASLGVTARVTASSLATAGASIGAIAVVSAGYASDGLSVVDTFNRSQEAADSYGGTLDEITANLADSNVGKYAQDLGIDLNRLSADLAQNGENGVYVSQVMDQLSESGHGVGAMFSGYLSGVVPFYTAEADKASASSRDLRDVIDGMGKTGVTASAAVGLFGVKLSDSQAAALDAASATDTLGDSAAAAAQQTFQTAEEVAASAKEMEDARKAAEQAAQGFFNLGESLNDSKVSLNGWIDDLEKQANALRNFRKNAIDAADKGLRGGLIAALQDAGPEGALRLGQLANASESEIGRANKAWRRGQAEIAAYTAEVTGVPKSASTTLTVQDQAAATIARIKGQLASIPKSVRTDYYVNQINAANKRAANKATGGYIAGPGTSTSDSIPARLSNGEYVIKASSVAKYGVAMFDTLNAQQFARGGLVGFADGGKADDKRRAAAAAKARNQARARSKARGALGDLSVNVTIDAEGASHALDKFSDELDHVRGLFKDAHLKWSDALKKQAHALTSSARQFDSLNATLAQTKADSAAFAASVGSSVSSASLTGNGLAGFEAGVAANTNDTNAAAAGLTAAVANGLDGALFDFLATSGDANLLGQFGGLSAAQIQQQENSYNALLAAQSSFGTGAANVKYAASIDAQTKAVKDMKQSIENLEKRLPGAVEKGTREGAEAGSRAGNKDSDKTTTQNTQTSSGGGHRHRRRP